jgi:hypothetical protein
VRCGKVDFAVEKNIEKKFSGDHFRERNFSNKKRGPNGPRFFEQTEISLCRCLNLKLGSAFSINANELALLALIFEFNKTFDQCEQRVVLADADVFTGLPFGAALACKNVAAQYLFAAELFQSEPLRIRIAAVSR